jgi:hypothetical protein
MVPVVIAAGRLMQTLINFLHNADLLPSHNPVTDVVKKYG